MLVSYRGATIPAILCMAAFITLASAAQSHAVSVLFLGEEWQPSSQGTVLNDSNTSASSTNPDVQDSPVFATFLNENSNVLGDVSSSLPGSGSAPVFGLITDPGGPVASHTISVGGTNVTASIVGWNDTLGMQVANAGGNLDGFGNGTAGMQSGAPRPKFASNAGSGVYLGTTGTQTQGGQVVRNAVDFDFTAFTGGGVFSFGLFGGDLETGDAALPGYAVAPAVYTDVTGKNSPDPHGGATGFLQLTFSDLTTENVIYSPDTSVFVDSSFSTTGNQSGTASAYGNETSRFVGITSDKLITNALFVVGDDDTDDDGSTEQLSFVAPLIFLDSTGAPVVPSNLNMGIPEPSTFLMLLLGIGGLGMTRRRRR